MDSLTQKQARVFDYICKHVEQNDSAPTLREISAHIGTKGTASAICHITALEKKGYIRRRGNSARGIVILKKQVAEEPSGEDEDAVLVPLVGTVRAGYPTPPIEDIEDYLKLDSFWLRGNGCYFLRVKGDSMIDDHILEGDLALVRPQATAENRDIVVAMVNEEATLKEFHRERDHIRLQPKNPSLKPIIMRPEDGSVSIIGKVIGIFRRLK